MELNKFDLYFAKVKENAIIPSKREGDAGYDLYPCFDEEVMIISPSETKLIPTGIATAFSSDFYMQIQERGSTGSKGIKYGAGVIDSGYRAEWFVPITNCSNKVLVISDITLYDLREKYEQRTFYGTQLVIDGYMFDKDECMIYPKSKAIAQAVVLPVPKMDEKEISFTELQQFTSERGTGSLGSSNK